MFLKQQKNQCVGVACKARVGGGGARPHLELLVVRLAAAVRLLGHVLVGVEQQTDAAVVTQLDVFDTCTQACDPAQPSVF